MDKLQHIFRAIIAGPSQSGKTHLVKRLINFIEPSVEEVYFHYSCWQKVYEDFPSHVTFIEGLPSSPPDGTKRTLIILDDLMEHVGSSPFISELFTKYSHHNNCSVIFITQNIYHQAKHLRSISLQANYLFLFENFRDRSQVITLAKQLYPGETHFFREVFTDATKERFGYLMVCTSSGLPERYRLRSNIFGENGGPPVYYVRK